MGGGSTKLSNLEILRASLASQSRGDTYLHWTLAPQLCLHQFISELRRKTSGNQSKMPAFSSFQHIFPSKMSASLKGSLQSVFFYLLVIENRQQVSAKISPDLFVFQEKITSTCLSLHLSAPCYQQSALYLLKIIMTLYLVPRVTETLHPLQAYFLFPACFQPCEATLNED